MSRAKRKPRELWVVSYEPGDDYPVAFMDQQEAVKHQRDIRKCSAWPKATVIRVREIIPVGKKPRRGVRAAPKSSRAGRKGKR